MLSIHCRGCGRTHYAECETAQQNRSCGKPDCPHLDPDGSFERGAGSDCVCCTLEHEPPPPGSGTTSPHRWAAMNCPRGHVSCAVVDCEVLTPLGQPCPGGHCGKGIEGCTACRPLRIEMLPGSATMHHVSGVV